MTSPQSGSDDAADLLTYRHDNRAKAHDTGQTRMKILVTGGTGLIGSLLRSFLTTSGHEVYCLTRTIPKSANDISWNPTEGELLRGRLEGLDAFVHLAGENIAGSRWNTKFKERIRSSRINGTRLLCDTIAQLQRPPKILISASAIGIYGDRGADLLNESSPPGQGFLAEVCQSWEAATEQTRAQGIRVVNLRIGFVLSRHGGGLAKMLTPFQLGGGGVIGTGRQYWSWIAVDDVIGIIHHCLMNDRMTGPVNATAPSPVTNFEFTKTLGRVLHRPTIFPMPAFAAKLALGEMANDLLLASARVMPNRLNESGYVFRHSTLVGALQHVLQSSGNQ